MKLRSLLVLFMLSASISACDLGKDYSKTIFTSFYPIYDFATRIAGDKFEIVNITPTGIEPHDYEPSARTITNICNSAGLFINGIGMESWTDILPREAKSKLFKVTENIEIKKIDGIEDQHVWLDPINAVVELKNIEEYLCNIDSANTDYYHQNYIRAKDDFDELYSDIEEIAKNLSIKQLVVSHAAFGYMCDRFSLEQIYINGLDPEEEPNAKTIEDIIDKVKKYNINTVYTEELVAKDIADKIAEEANVKTDILYTIEGLTSEQVGKEDYISLMRKNFEKIGRSNR